MSEIKRKTPGATIWVSPSTRDAINSKKRKDETADQFIRRKMR